MLWKILTIPFASIILANSQVTYISQTDPTTGNSVNVPVTLVQQLQPAVAPNTDGYEYVYVNGQWLTVVPGTQTSQVVQTSATSSSASKTMTLAEYRSKFANSEIAEIASAASPVVCQDASERGYTGDVCCSIQSGDFNNPAVWDCNVVPTKDHAVIIRHNIRLTTIGSTDVAAADPVVFVRALRLVKSNEPQYKDSVGFLRAGTLPGNICSSSVIATNPLSQSEITMFKKAFSEVPGVSGASDLTSICSALQGKQGFNGLITREEDFEMAKTIFISVVHPDAAANIGSRRRLHIANSIEELESKLTSSLDSEEEKEMAALEAEFSSSLRGPSAPQPLSINSAVPNRRLASVVPSGVSQSLHSHNAAYPVQTSLQAATVDTTSYLWSMDTTATLSKKEQKLYSSLTNDIIVQLEPTTTAAGFINIVDPYRVIPKYESGTPATLGTSAADLSPQGTSGVVVEEGASLLLFSDATLAVEQIGPVVNNGTFFIGKSRDVSCTSTNTDACKHASLIAHGAIHALKPIRAHWLVVGEADYPMRAAWEGLIEYPNYLPLWETSQISFFGNVQVGYIHPGMQFSFSRMSAPWPSLRPILYVQNVDSETQVRVNADVIDDDQFNGCCSDTYDESVAVFEISNSPFVLGRYRYYTKNVGEARDGASQQVNILAPRIEMEGHVAGLPQYIPEVPISSTPNPLDIKKVAGTDKDILYLHCTEECSVNGYKFGNLNTTSSIEVRFDLPKTREVYW